MSETQPISPPLHDLEKDNLLERLINENRTPICFFKAKIGNGEIAQMKDIVFCFVPPEGTLSGDQISGDPSWGFEVQSSEGVVRGNCKMYSMSPDQAKRIMDSIDAHLSEK